MATKFSWKGCLIGCGAVVLLFLALTISTGVWLTKKGDFDASSTTLNENAGWFVRAHLVAEDELLVNFLATQLKKLNDANVANQQFPGFIRDMQQKKSIKDLKKLLPLEVELSAQEGSEDFQAAVGFSTHNNLVGLGYWFFKREAKKKGNLHESNGIPYVGVVEDENSFFLSLWQNIFYFSESQSGLEGMLGQQEQISHEGFAKMAGVDFASPIYGFANARMMRIMVQARQLEELPDEVQAARDQFFSELEYVNFDFYLKDEETMAGSFNLKIPKSEGTMLTLEQFCTEMTRDVKLKVETEVLEIDEGYRVTYVISGLNEIYDELHESLEEL